MKLEHLVILSGLLAGLIPTGVAQEAATPPKEKEALVIDRIHPGAPARPLLFSKNLAPPRCIGEGGSSCLLHYCDVNPASVAPSFFHLVVAANADGKQFALYHDESRAPEPVARMNKRGDVAILCQSCVKIFFAPDYKPVNIRKLRSDVFLKVDPKIEHFTIRDVTWGDGVLVCCGRLSIASAEYPFLSRLLFDEKGEVSDHQILWTTWKPGIALQKQQISGQHPAANDLVRSLHVQGELVLWKNVGQPGQSPPKDLPPVFQKPGWQCTELATGTTRPLAEADPVDRDRLAQIEKEIEQTKIRRKLQP